MKLAAVLSLTLMIAALSGCSNEVMYNSLRANQELNCSKLPRSDQDDCYRKSGASYDEYQRQLKEHPQ